MLFLLRFVQVSHFGTYANPAGWQRLIQISLKCRGSHAGEMACLPRQLQRDLSQEEPGEGQVCKEGAGREKKTRNPPEMLTQWQKVLHPCYSATRYF